MKTFTLKKNSRKIKAGLGWVLIFQVLAYLVDNPVLFPSPRDVFISFLKITTDLRALVSLGASSIKIMLGLSLGLGLGLILGLLAYRFNFLRPGIDLGINIIKSSPIASITIIILTWVKSSSMSIYIVGLVVLPNIYIACLDGLGSVGKDMLELIQVFNISFKKSLAYIYLESLKKSLGPSLYISVAMAFKSGVSAEVLALTSRSIGEYIYYSKIYLDTSDLFAWTLAIILVTKFFEGIILSILREVGL